MNMRAVFFGALFLSLVITAPVALAVDKDLLEYGDTLAGSISVAGEVDVHTFVCQAGDIVLVRLAEATAALEPRIVVTGPPGQTYSQYGSQLAEILTDPLNQNFTCTIQVSDNGNDDTGDYSLHIQRINNPVGASSLNFGDTVSGSVASRAQTTAHTLAASAGDQVLFRLAEDEATTGIYPRMRIYQSDGTLVATHYGANTVELNTVEIPASGTYTVLAMDYYGTGTGDYWLHCQCTNDPAGAMMLEYGDTHNDEWLLRAETDAYTFTGGANDTLVVTLTELGTTTEPLVRLYGPDGVQLAGHTASTEAEISDLHLPSSGIYTILTMDSPGTDTGPYRLRLVGGEGITPVPDDDLPVAQIALHGCQPNPFNPATQIHFDLTHSATVHLSIYALDGRRLTTLADGIMSEGRHAVAWSGIDNRGRRVASGTYLVRLLVDGKQMVKRTTLLK